MASNFDLSKELETTPEKTNHARLCRLLIEGGTKALKVVFDNIHPAQNLGSALMQQQNQRALQNLKNRKVINQKQWGVLYPKMGNVSSADFDITLIMVLLRNICNLRQPKTGWDNQPKATDHSKEADLARVKFYRNKLCHSQKAFISNQNFHNYWDEISDALVRLGAKKEDVEKLRTDSMDSELEQKYINDLNGWAKAEVEVRQLLQQVLHKMGPSEDGDNFCSNHKKSLLELFCETCNQPICMTCTIVKHKDHTLKDLKDAAQEFRNKASRDKQKLQLKKEEVHMNKEGAIGCKVAMEMQCQQQVQLVEELAKDAIKKIKMEENTLVCQIKEDYEKLNKKLDREVKTLKVTEETTTNTLANLENILDRVHPAQLLVKSKEVSDQIQKVMAMETKFQNEDVVGVQFSPLMSHFQNKLGQLHVSAVRRKSPKTADSIRVGDSLVLEVNSKAFKNHALEEGNQLTAEALTIENGATVDLDLVTSAGNRDVYTVTFTGQKEGRQKISVRYKDQHIQGSPIEIEVLSWKLSQISSEAENRKPTKGTPCCVTIDPDSNILFGDRNNSRIVVTDKEGKLKRIVSLADISDSFGPFDIAISASGEYFLTNSDRDDCISCPIVVCDTDGKFIRALGEGRLKRPYGIAINGKTDTVYVTDLESHAVLIFKCQSGQFIKSFGRKGSTKGLFSFPNNIAIDSQSRVIVSDSGNHRVQVFSHDGRFLFVFGKLGKRDGQFDYPRGVAVDRYNNIYVCDGFHNRIQMFDSIGRFIRHIGNGQDALSHPTAIAVTNDNPCRVVVTDNEYSVVKIL